MVRNEWICIDFGIDFFSYFYSILNIRINGYNFIPIHRCKFNLIPLIWSSYIEEAYWCFSTGSVLKNQNFLIWLQDCSGQICLVKIRETKLWRTSGKQPEESKDVGRCSSIGALYSWSHFLLPKEEETEDWDNICLTYSLEWKLKQSSFLQILIKKEKKQKKEKQIDRLSAKNYLLSIQWINQRNHFKTEIFSEDWNLTFLK